MRASRSRIRLASLRARISRLAASTSPRALLSRLPGWGGAELVGSFCFPGAASRAAPGFVEARLEPLGDGAPSLFLFAHGRGKEGIWRDVEARWGDCRTLPGRQLVSRPSSLWKTNPFSATSSSRNVN